MTVLTSKTDMQKFKKIEKLGEGTYGVVYKAIELETKKFVALKKIKFGHYDEGINSTTIREISLLRTLTHPNIVKLENILFINSELYLVFEYQPYDLKAFLDKMPHGENLSLAQLKRFTYEIFEGVRYCHERRILHRDLKPQNILVSMNREIKIADFGLGREHPLPIQQLTHEVVTLWYRPPEILLGQPGYSGACDVWGIGCIVAEMATRRALLMGDSEIDQIFTIYRMFGTPNDTIWPGVTELPEYKSHWPNWRAKDMSALVPTLDQAGLDLLLQTFVYPPTKRIVCTDALLNPWFDDIREDCIAIYGNHYPHCGSAEYQEIKLRKEITERKRKEKAEEKENAEENAVAKQLQKQKQKRKKQKPKQKQKQNDNTRNRKRKRETQALDTHYRRRLVKDKENIKPKSK